MKQINLRLTPLTLAALDELRDGIPRNTWIARAVDEKIARDTLPHFAEQGRRLASQREDLIAQGVNPADLAVPLAPIDPPPRRRPTPQTPVGLDHPFIGQGPSCKRVGCTSPKDKAAHLPE